VRGSTDKLKFGLWVEPEMVNPQSELYEAHPDWVLHAGRHKRTEQRNQLVLDLSRREVQDYLIDAIGSVLASADVSFVKWDNNRAMHELPSPATAHAYMLGLYRVIDSLTRRFPHILWDGCASGGGRFDPGLLHYWPQSWTSDNTDALDRLHIQFGTSLVYPPSSMGAHISAVPNHQVQRVTPLEFRAHVAMMGGSFGFELDLQALNDDERRQIHDIIALSEEVSPYVLKGDLYRLAAPEGNYPAALFMLPDGSAGVLLAFCMQARIHKYPPPLFFAGLDCNAAYEVDCKTYTGSELMHSGLKLHWDSRDYQSRVLFVRRLPDNC
jgi:alpha-galactosidase